MKRHSLKCWPEYFKPLTRGEIELSLRKNDRNYQPGDIVQFYEWTKKGGLSGRRSNFYRIRYVLLKTPGLQEGYAALLLDGPFYSTNAKEILPDNL